MHLKPLLLSTLVAVAPGTCLAEDYELCRQARTADQARDFLRALSLYEQCIEKGNLGPRALVQAYREQGMTRRHMREPDKAIEWARRAQALQPTDPWIDHANMALALSDAGRYEEALGEIARTLALNPGHPETFFNRGLIRQRQGADALAVEDFLTAYRLGLRSADLSERLAAYRAFDPPTAAPGVSPSQAPGGLKLQPSDPGLHVSLVRRQACAGPNFFELVPHPDAVTIVATRAVPLTPVGLRFELPGLTDRPRPSVKVRLSDRSRQNVVDHYILLSDHPVHPTTAAVVVTEPPAAYDTPEKILAMGATYNLQAAQRAHVTPLTRQMQGPHGWAFESVLQQREGSYCFPTSQFRMVPTAIGPRLTAISRFTVVQGKLVEFALIVELPAQTSAQQGIDFARQAMDQFWLGLKPL